MHKIVSWTLLLVLRTIWRKLLGEFQSLALLQTEVKKGWGKVFLNGEVVGKEQVRSWLWPPAWCLPQSWEVPGACAAEELNRRAGGEADSAD